MGIRNHINKILPTYGSPTYIKNREYKKEITCDMGIDQVSFIIKIKQVSMNDRKKYQNHAKVHKELKIIFQRYKIDHREKFITVIINLNNDLPQSANQTF